MLLRTGISVVLVAAFVSACGGGVADPSAAVLAQPAADRSGADATAPSPADTPASPPAYSGPMNTSLQAMIQAALADAARQSGRDVSALKVVSAESVIWPDGSLGCPEPGMMYTQALVRGYLIRIDAGGRMLDYHASAGGQLVLCPPGRATPHLPDDKT